MNEVQEAAVLEASITALGDNPTSQQIIDTIWPFSQNAINIALHNLGGGGGGSGGWPVRDLIVAYNRPKAESNFDNVSLPSADVASGLGIIPFGVRFSDNTNGAWVEWYTSLGAGTYALTLKGFSFTGGGILAFSLDGVAIDQPPHDASSATVDTYADSGASGQFFQAEVCHDLTIDTSAVYVLRATVTGKNASSSGFVCDIVYVALDMVAAP